MGITAKQFNDWRVIPRVLIVAAYTFTGYGWLLIFQWFSTLNFEAMSEVTVMAVAGFPAVILSVLTTNVGTLTNNYFRTGSLGGNDG